MESTKRPSEATASGILTAFGSMAGLALGPSVIAVLTISPYILPIEKEFGWTRVEVSLAFTIVAYMIVIASPIQGWLVDRFGPRRVVLTSIPLFALSLAALFFTPKNLLVYYLLWAMVPVLGLGLWPLGYLQAVSRWFDRKLGLALGCANAGIGVGTLVLPLIVSPLIAAYSWRHALLVLAALVLFVSWPVVAFCLREPAAETAAQRTARTSFGMPFREALREPTFAMLNVAFFMLGLTATSLVSQQVPLLREAGWTLTETTRLQVLFGFGLLFARIAVGFVIDFIFAPRVMMAVSIGGAAACILYATYPNAAYISALLIGFLLGAEFDVLAFLIKRYYGNIAYGKIYGLIFGAFYLGSGLGIAGLAWCRQTFGNYNTGLFIAAGMLTASALLLSFMPKYRFGAGAEGAAQAAPHRGRSEVIQPVGSPQMKPRSFGQLFAQCAPLAAGAFFGIVYLLDPDVRNSLERAMALLFGAIFFGIVMGLVAAYFYQGETIVKESADLKSGLKNLQVRLAESGYSLETQTESIHTFKPSLQFWVGGRIYIIPEGLRLHVVGPSYVLKKLRNA